MGLLPCPLACHSNEDSDTPQSRSTTYLHSLSSTSSLSSQPSLPSVPSLTSHKSQPHDDPSQPLSATRHRLVSTLNGHSSAVFSLALAGKLLYSGSSDSEIRSWSRDPSTPAPDNNTVVIPSSRGAVKSIVVSGDALFAAHQDHKIRVWRIDDAANHYPRANTLPTVRDRLARFFRAKDYVEVRRRRKRTWVHHVDAISALALSRDGSLLYSASWDRTFKVWRTSDFRCLESAWNAHDDAINAVVASPAADGTVYTGSADTRIKVWRRHDGEKKHRLVGTLEKHKSAVNALALSTDGSVLYSGACDRSIIVWEKGSCGTCEGGGDGRQMAVAGALRGHKKAILCLVVVADLVCSGSADKTVRIWRRGREREYSCLAVLEGHRGPVKCLAAAVDTCGGDGDSGSGTSYNIYSGSLDFDIKVWQVWVPLVSSSVNQCAFKLVRTSLFVEH